MKPIEEMTFEEFIDWSVGHIILSIGQGNLKSILYGIFLPFLNQWLPSHGWEHKGTK